MALTKEQQALKDAITGGKSKADIESAEYAAMRSGWESMSAADQARLREQSGDLWASSPASRWGNNAVVVDPYAEIKRQQAALLEAQKQARIQALGAQRQSALSALEAERGTVAPEFLKQRGTLQTTAQQAGRGAQQSLAARGLASSGAAVQSDIARNVALQQGMSSIGEAEAGTLANIARRQSDVENAYSTGVAQAESEIAAQQAQAQIDLLMKAQELEEARTAEETKNKFQLELLAQEQANKEAIEKMRIAAEDARAKGDFDREKELLNFKNSLEADTIRLRASTRSTGGGGGGSTGSASDLNTTQRAMAKAVQDQITRSPGNMSAIINAITDPAVKAYLRQIYGTQMTGTSPTSYSELNLTRQLGGSIGL